MLCTICVPIVFVVRNIADAVVFDSVYRCDGGRENFDKSCIYSEVCHNNVAMLHNALKNWKILLF